MAKNNTPAEETGVATVPEAGELVGYASQGESALAVIKENLGKDGVTARSLPRIKIPTGGGEAWTIPTWSGTEVKKEVIGVIAHWQTQRLYWERSGDETPEGTPPDCVSLDGDWGEGNNGTEDGELQYTADGKQIWIGRHACISCPLNEFGTATKGKGKACKEVRPLFVLMEDGVLPYVVPLPPTSLQPARDYFLRLASAGISYYTVETKLTLEKKGSGAQSYSVARLEASRKLTPEEVVRVRAYRAGLIPMLDAVQVAQATDIGD